MVFKFKKLAMVTAIMSAVTEGATEGAPESDDPATVTQAQFDWTEWRTTANPSFSKYIEDLLGAAAMKAEDVTWDYLRKEAEKWNVRWVAYSEFYINYVDLFIEFAGRMHGNLQDSSWKELVARWYNKELLDAMHAFRSECVRPAVQKNDIGHYVRPKCDKALELLQQKMQPRALWYDYFEYDYFDGHNGQVLKSDHRYRILYRFSCWLMDPNAEKIDKRSLLQSHYRPLINAAEEEFVVQLNKREEQTGYMKERCEPAPGLEFETAQAPNDLSDM